MPVPIIRAVGIEVGKLFRRCEGRGVVRREAVGNQEVKKYFESREWRKGGVAAAAVRHTAVMSAWQACDEVCEGMREKLWWAESPKLGMVSESDKEKARKGVRRLEWYVW
jgi:hypothetical protein